jgi:hypothetical protein
MAIESFLSKMLNESAKKWSADVEPKTKVKKDFFKQSAKKIAMGIKAKDKSFKAGMSMLNFYINRAGENLSPEDKVRLEKAKNELRKVYGVKESFQNRFSKILKEDETSENGDVSGKDVPEEGVSDSDIEDIDATTEEEEYTTVTLQGENILALLNFIKDNGVEGMEIKIGDDENHEIFTLDENDLISSIETTKEEEPEEAPEVEESPEKTPEETPETEEKTESFTKYLDLKGTSNE